MSYLKAEDVLREATLAIEDFSSSGLTPYWRTRWVSVLSLLRMVGHVLVHVDAKEHPRLKERIDRQFREAGADPIYKEFIKDQRDSLLKEFEIDMHHEILLRGAAGYAVASGATPPQPELTLPPLGSRFFMRSGPFAGQNPIELAERAVEFWRDYIARVLDGFSDSTPPKDARRE